MQMTPFGMPVTTSRSDRVELRDYQEVGVRFLRDRKRVYLADPMGVGKSAQSLVALKRERARRTLVIAPKSVLHEWHLQFKLWWPECTTFMYTGPSRHSVAEAVQSKVRDTNHPLAVIANYGLEGKYFLHEIDWDAVIWDEAHKLRNRKTARWKTAKRLTYGRKRRPKHVHVMTGSPVIKHPIDVVAPIMLLEPRIRSYWRVVETYFAVLRDALTGVEICGCKDVDGFKRWVGKYMLRRPKSVLRLPDKIRRRIPVTMSSEQAAAYTDIKQDLAHQLDTGRWITAPTIVAQLTRLRQVLVCPRVLGLQQIGAAEVALARLASDLADVCTRLVVFTPFKLAVPPLCEALERHYDQVYRVHGGMSQRTIQGNLSRFRANVSALVCTLDMAEGFNLTEACHCTFIGAHWNASTNEQAEDRLHRLGQENVVSCWYIYYPDTVDTHLMELVRTKFSLAQLLAGVES